MDINNTHDDELVLRLNLSSFISITRMDISLYLDTTLMDKIHCDEVSCSLSAALEKARYTLKFDLKEYAPQAKPCTMTALLNVTTNPLSYIESTYTFIKESFDFQSYEAVTGKNHKIHRLNDNDKSIDAILELDWDSINHRLESEKTNHDEFDKFPLQKLTTFM